MTPIEHGDAVQLTLPTMPAYPDRPRRPALWRDEMRRLASLLDDQRVRDRRDHDEALARLSDALADMRMRLRDVESASGLDAIRLAPTGNTRLRAFAGSRQ